jgi:hypothetical protein
MKKKGKRTKGMEEAHPFAGMSQVNPNAAGVDIGAVEIVACVAGDETTQIVKAFGNYTVDTSTSSVQACKRLASGCMNIRSKLWRWKARACIGFRCLKNWSGRVLNVC